MRILLLRVWAYDRHISVGSLPDCRFAIRIAADERPDSMSHLIGFCPAHWWRWLVLDESQTLSLTCLSGRRPNCVPREPSSTGHRGEVTPGARHIDDFLREPIVFVNGSASCRMKKRKRPVEGGFCSVIGSDGEPSYWNQPLNLTQQALGFECSHPIVGRADPVCH
jgi:hypothetical protein